MKKKRATSSLRVVDGIDQAIDQLFREPPASPMDFRLRVMRFDADRVRTALARRLIEAELAPVDRLFLVQWLIELEPGNAAIALLDLVSDPTKSLDQRVPAFLLLTKSWKAETRSQTFSRISPQSRASRRLPFSKRRVARSSVVSREESSLRRERAADAPP